MADALARDARQPVAQCGAGGQRLQIGAPAIPGQKAVKAQDAQVILGDAFARVANKAQPPRCEVGQAADRIQHPARGIGIKRVHGEIAAPGVLGNVVRKGHAGAATVGFDIAAKAGDLIARATRDHGNRAMVDPGRHRAQPGRLGQTHGRFGGGGRGDVDVRDRLAQQGIAHRAAHHKRLMAGAFQQVQDLTQGGIVQKTAGDACRIGGGVGQRFGHAFSRSASACSTRAVAPQM